MATINVQMNGFTKDKRGLLRKGETYASSIYDALTRFGRDARNLKLNVSEKGE